MTSSAAAGRRRRLFFRIGLVAINACLLAVPAVRADAPVRVACVGDSTTMGAGVTNRAAESYPAQLQALLGSGYVVENRGVGSCTLIRQGRPNVWATLQRLEAAADKPDIVVVDLGINDTCGGKRACWAHKDDFPGDYRDLVDRLRALPSKPRLWLCAPTPMLPDLPGLAEARKKDLQERAPRLQELIGHVRTIAREKGVGFIDLNAPLSGHPEFSTDGVHLNAAGYRAVAEQVAAALKKGQQP